MMVGVFPKASRSVYRACHFSTAEDRPRGHQESQREKSWHLGEASTPTPLSPAHSQFLSCPCLTRKHLVPARACDGGQVLYQMLAARGFATATTTQEDDGLVLTAHQHRPVCSLGHGVDVGCHIFSPTPLEHVHHLGWERDWGKA